MSVFLLVIQYDIAVMLIDGDSWTDWRLLWSGFIGILLSGFFIWRVFLSLFDNGFSCQFACETSHPLSLIHYWNSPFCCTAIEFVLSNIINKMIFLQHFMLCLSEVVYLPVPVDVERLFFSAETSAVVTSWH